MLTEQQIEHIRQALTSEPNVHTTLRERLVQVMRQLILGGAFARRQRLPPSRQLAAQLALSRGTIEACYSQLEQEGILRREVGRGSFISLTRQPLVGLASRPPAPSVDTLAARLSQRGQAGLLDGSLIQRTASRAFTPGLPETRAFPMDTWEQLQHQVIRHSGDRTLLHGEPQGEETLREAIAEYLQAERGVMAQAAQILVLNSTQQALMLCAHLLLDRGDGIYVEDPGYPGAMQAFRAAQLTMHPVPVDCDGIQIDPIIHGDGRIKALYLTPSNQYPTGTELSLSRRLALLEWAAQQEAWILEDDYDGEFHYRGRATASLQGLDRHQRTLYLGTFSKTLFPTLRIAFMVLPESLVLPMTLMRMQMEGYTPVIAQLQLARFIAGGHFRTHIRTMKQLYASRAESMAEALRQHLGIADIQLPACGLQLVCPAEDAAHERRLSEGARALGIHLPGIGRLFHGSATSYGWLMGFAALTPMEIDHAVGALKKL